MENLSEAKIKDVIKSSVAAAYGKLSRYAASGGINLDNIQKTVLGIFKDNKQTWKGLREVFHEKYTAKMAIINKPDKTPEEWDEVLETIGKICVETIQTVFTGAFVLFPKPPIPLASELILISVDISLRKAGVPGILPRGLLSVIDEYQNRRQSFKEFISYR